MESKAHYALIGTLVLLFLIAVLTTVTWLSGNNLDQKYDEYIVTFDAPVRGVTEAAEVRFNGIKVGEVTQIRLAPDNPNKVLIRIEVFEETPVDINAYAQLEPQGLTGLSYVLLYSGGAQSSLLKEAGGRGPFFIDGRQSQIDSLISGGGDIVETVQTALNSVVQVLDDDSRDDFKVILENLAAITTQYRDDPVTMERLEQTLAGIDKASAEVSAAAGSVDVTARDTQAFINNNVAPVMNNLELVIADLRLTIADMRALTNTVNDTVGEAGNTINSLNAGALRDMEASMLELRELLITLNRVALELEQNPAKFIVGEKREVLELPQ